jgi:predicted transcriptional regulator
MQQIKKYSVFVSSTYQDLVDERKEVIQALLELDCIPIGMELFPATDDDQWTLIKELIDECDYYILIVGGRYGSLNKEGISFTQMEYEYALKIGIPVISFLHKSPDKITIGKTDKDSEKEHKLQDFKKIASEKLVKFWSSPEELGSIDDDLFEVKFAYKTERRSDWVSDKIQVKWNNLFSRTCAILIDEAKEEDYKSRLNSYILHLLKIDAQEYYNVSVISDNFSSILIQLKALNLIEKSNKKRSLKDNSTYWKLTENGDKLLTKLRAIQRNNTEEQFED